MVFLFIILTPMQVFGQEDEDEEIRKSLIRFQQLSVEERNQLLPEIIEVPIEEQKIVLMLEKDEEIKVRHIVKGGVWVEDQPRMIKILPGIHSELNVTDKDDDNYSFYWENETFEESEYVILQQKLRSFDLFIEYKLKNYLELDDGLWNKQIEFPTDVEIMFDDEINTVYANLRPIDVSNSDGINCIGCVVSLAFFDNESGMKILIDDLSENVNVLSNGEIFDVEFSSELRQLDFKTEKNDQLVTLEIPLEIMLYPFEVYLTEEEDTVLDQIDKIRNTEFSHNENDVKLSFIADSVGRIWVLGATEEEHKIDYERITTSNAPVQVEKEEVIEKEVTSPLEYYEGWGEKSANTNDDDNGMIYLLAGIGVAVIIGVIIKIKKN
tara:strand:+ start:93 stop:1235 length:1143 start_codon:yes stop_codon:yes gene_type:complete